MNITENLQHQHSLAQEDLLYRISSRIRQSLELQEVLAATAREVRSFLGTDRVKVYRFHPDEHGEVIAESIYNDRLPSLLGLHFPADDIPPQARELFLKARQRSIVDLVNQQIILSRPDAPKTTATEDLTVEEVRKHSIEEIYQRAVDPCHVEYLMAMGVKSSLVVPILHRDQLWGLLVSHHAEPRLFSEQELQVLQLLVDQVSIAIAQASLLSQARNQAKREAIINRVATLLHALPTIELQEALEETVSVLQGSGGRICLMTASSGEVVVSHTCGTQLANSGTDQLIEQHLIWRNYFKSKTNNYNNGLKPITDLYKEPQLRTLAPAFQNTQIRGLLVIPLHYRQEFIGYLSIFRDEIDVETLWAGQVDSDQRQFQPRNSFAAWRELKRGQAYEWLPDEVELAQALGSHFSMAIQQYELYRQVQSLNTNLESQVQERTAQLQQTTEQQQALFEVTSKIRQSLELNTIFHATVSEVRKLLDADRVAVFRFDAESGWDNGEFIAEAVLPGFTSVLRKKVHDHCFGEQYAVHYQRGRVQAVADIQNAGLSDCHVQVLSQFQVKANLIVPLIKSEQLWGLLCIHYCQDARQWKPVEIDFVTQVATQLGVALQQAELLVQTQQQAEQLTKAIQDLQKTQSQLVQTEKMSSLGQLVAGVAHEINNPVNFIYGNLNHAATYAQDLLSLIAIYQEQYPQPNAQTQAVLEEVDLEFLSADFPKILSSMRIGADRIRQIVQSLRHFSRLDEAEKKPIDIHEGIDSTLLILQHRLKANGSYSGIEIIKEYGQLPRIECYAGQLNQVFMNVLSNAIDALEAYNERRSPQEVAAFPSQITIKTALLESQGSNPRVVIQIADNGPGMVEAVRSRLFDPFFTTKPVGQGTGLGLSISYQIVVEKHNGVLKCISQPGEGAEFWIEIPLR